MSLDFRPSFVATIGWCSGDDCQQYDGKRCKLTGFQPRGICEPWIVEALKKAADATKAERARVRREEVEPLVACLKELLAEAEAYEENGCRFDRERNDRARAALAAAEARREETGA